MKRFVALFLSSSFFFVISHSAVALESIIESAAQCCENKLQSYCARER